MRVRGARPWDFQQPSPSCPTTGTLDPQQLSGNDYDMQCTWSPDVLVNTLMLQVDINGNGWQDQESHGPVQSDDTFNLNFTTIAGPGDELRFRFLASDVALCPDFQSNEVGPFTVL